MQPFVSKRSWSMLPYTATGGWWIVHTTAMRASLARLLISVMMFAAAAASSPVVGSSAHAQGRAVDAERAGSARAVC